MCYFISYRDESKNRFNDTEIRGVSYNFHSLPTVILQFYRLLAKEESVRETIDSDGKTESEYEYIQDHKYTGSPYHSQPCFSLGGSSYTPPGWKRLYKEKKTSKKC